MAGSSTPPEFPGFLQLLEAKRDGATLSEDHIRWTVAAYTRGEIPDYQMAAFLMAVYFRGLDAAEAKALTLALRDSGSRITLAPGDPRPLVDKHSTGGVGDKTSLVLVPLLTCLGCRVPMIAGRALGITGGTLDKLESIPGLRTELSPEEIAAQMSRVHCVIAGQGDQLVPADRTLYALRDVTGTIPSVALICASILSKKLCEGISALLLDVKFGSGAFMPTRPQARELATWLVALARDCGLSARAVLTDMNSPHGQAVGNWLEVKEAVECLHDRGPADLQRLILELAGHLLNLRGLSRTASEGRDRAARALSSGEPLRVWLRMIEAQGARLPEFEEMLAADHLAPAVLECVALEPGYVEACDAGTVGDIVRSLGGGRTSKGGTIDPRVGIDRLIQPGDAVEPGMVLGRIHAADMAQAEAALLRLQAAIRLAPTPPPPREIVVEMIGG